MTALDGARELLGDRVGFRFDPAMRRRLKSALGERASALEISEARYVESLRGDPGALQELIDRVAVPETYFFRESQHFDALVRHVLPKLDAEVNIWCAACSTGPEAYSIAMVLTDSGVKRWRILATDVSTPALARTASGRYSKRELRGLSEESRDRHLVADGGGGFTPRPGLRERITVRRHNLVSDPPPEVGSFDVVFCRNVLIYMRPRQTEAVLATLRAAMKSDGYLFIGASESLWHLDTDLAAVTMGDAYAYRRKQPARAPGPLPRPPAPAPPPRRPPPPPTRPAEPDRMAPAGEGKLDELVARGDAAFARDDVDGAIAAYREACRLAPAAVFPHALLGLALEQSGDDEAARRSFESAWESLGRSDPQEAERVLEGYRAEELARLLIGKLQGAA